MEQGTNSEKRIGNLKANTGFFAVFISGVAFDARRI